MEGCSSIMLGNRRVPRTLLVCQPGAQWPLKLSFSWYLQGRDDVEYQKENFIAI